ncbi:MAG TPA: SDR family oxidoreductase [Candidatus Dormibacteraeota bacterium]|jgi:3-oxoacyl-[acyl-carrier protein] reductase|nr:SDR family oxidoreductase [Candidatus Dormibacteraeota bacterium]
MPTCLITGAGRRNTIAAACALGLAGDGWDIALHGWPAYDRALAYTDTDDGPTQLLAELRAKGVRAELHASDLADPAAVPAMFDVFAKRLPPVTAVVACHARDIELPLMETTAEEFDLHFAVNARAVALMIQEFARRLPGNDGRFVAFTSDDVHDNAPYGVSKGALDRIITAAAMELGPRGIRANCINPGPTDTGWITDDIRPALIARTPLGRIGQPADAAALVRFLLSPEGAWISGQVLHSNGAFR